MFGATTPPVTAAAPTPSATAFAASGAAAPEPLSRRKSASTQETPLTDAYAVRNFVRSYTPRAEEQRLDGGSRDRERDRELVVREPAELAHEERVTLLPGQLLDCAPQRREIHAANCLGERIRQRRSGLEVLPVGRARACCVNARPALVARDRREPRRRLTGIGAVQERAVRGEERLLRRVLRLGAVPQQRIAEPADRAGVQLVELLGPRASRPR